MSGVVGRHSELLQDGPKKKKTPLQRSSGAGFKGQGREALSGSPGC